MGFKRDGYLSRPRYDMYSLLKTDVLARREWVPVGSSENYALHFYDEKWLPQSAVFSQYSWRLRVATFPRSPFLDVDNVDKDSGKCNVGVHCLLANTTNQETIKTQFDTYREETIKKVANRTVKPLCCYGICVDLLTKLSKDLTFDYDLYVMGEANQSGVFRFGEWTGVVGELTKGHTDMVVAPLPMNSERSQAVDFTRPYFFSTLALMTYHHEGRTRIGGFLEPLDWSMWVGIFITLHVTALAATFYEWHSPYGLTPNGRDRNRVFSLPSALTLSWSVLFSHTVATKSPKCWSSRFLLNIWACFSVVFIASYTANLAAFMVGEVASHVITGINDPKVIVFLTRFYGTPSLQKISISH